MSKCCACNCLCAPVFQCKKCRISWFCSDDCSSNRASEHNLCCVYAADGEFSLRFKVGDLVFCKVGNVSIYESLREAIVLRVFPTKSASYLVRFNDNTEQNIVLDSNGFIRSRDFDISDRKQLILHHLKNSVSIETLREMVSHFKLDWNYYSFFLLHNSASSGNLLAIMHLKSYGMDITTVDSKGRNILQLAVMSNMLTTATYLVSIGCPMITVLQQAQLMLNIDDDGRNAVHAAVILGGDSKNTLLEAILICAGKTTAQMCEDIVVQSDNKGRTPLEYAYMLKRVFMYRLLFSVTIDQMIKRFTRVMNKVHLCEEGQERVYANYLQLLSIKGITLENAIMEPTDEMFFDHILRLAVREGFNHCLEWMIDGNWEVLTRLRGSRTQNEYVNSLIVDGMAWSHAGFKKFSIEKEEVPIARSKMLLELYTVLKDWDGSEFLLIFCDRFNWAANGDRANGILRPRFTDPHFKQSYCTVDQNALFESFVCDFMWVFSEFRSDAFKYMVSVADRSGSAVVPLQMFILHSLPRMLFWYTEHYSIDLQAPLVSNYDLRQFAETQPWMRDSTGVFQWDLTIDKFLQCLIFAGDFAVSHMFYHEKDVMQWDVVCVFNGMNLLQLAIASGSYIITKSELALETTSVNLVHENGLNAFHVAIQRGHYHVAELLLPIMGNDSHGCEGDFTTAYYAKDSNISFLRGFAVKTHRRQKCEDLRDVISSQDISARSLQHFMNSDSELFALLFEDEARNPEFSVVARDIMSESVRRGRVDVCRWVCEQYELSSVANTQRDRSLVRHLHILAANNTAKAGSMLCAYLKYFASKIRSSSPAKAAVVIQSVVRGRRTRVRYCHYLRENHIKWLRFETDWASIVSELCAGETVWTSTWLQIKSLYRMIATDLEEDGETHCFEALLDEPLPSITASRASSNRRNVMTVCSRAVNTEEIVCSDKRDKIELSQRALRWLDGADAEFRCMFQKRIVQLAAGERSYALSKRLQHAGACPVFETKLDVGMRILWTKLQRGAEESILVWFVSHHDKVSRNTRLISDSCDRLSRELVVSAQGGGSEECALQLGEDDVLIDPAGNCPLKVYSTTCEEMECSAADTFKPPLRLNNKQRQVNNESGTVLLLGRSGTGKTLCLGDRMIADRRRNPATKQLFICRNKSLCEFVRHYQQQYADADSLKNMHFMTLASFTSQMTINVKMDHGASGLKFLTENKVDFRSFFGSIFVNVRVKCSVAPSVAWLQIRSFIKGSIEAVVQRRPLTIEQYTDFSTFGADRCRLSAADRNEVYALYLRYEDVLKTQGLWDDADYTLDLLTRSKLEPLSTQYDKVYVDEVQDNTQAEIVLYFLAAGMNTQSLFLAGDPAQSVVEGVDFRFEDVRSIVHKLSGGKHNINRPLKLSVNYRSHSGILNCAAAVLDKMFAMFPGAAKVLPKDVGLFKGPRPACCLVDGMEGLAKLLAKNERLVVLCVDEDVERVESELTRSNVKNTVLGIRAAKGLEFVDVVVLNFFRDVPSKDYQAWKGLFTSERPSESTAHPHVELQLKFLYTAVTRSCNRLLFVETEKTQLSSVMFRWLLGAGLAEMMDMNSEATELMTSDEWRVQGIEFALSAEGESTAMFLEKAAKCFQNAGDTILLTRVSAELQLARVFEVVRSGSGSTIASKDIRTAASAVMDGIKAGLLEQVMLICDAIKGRVEYDEIFGWEIVKRLGDVKREIV